MSDKSAIVAAIGNGAAFRKGREFAGWLGIVARAPKNVVVVAMANKLERITWAVGEDYRPTANATAA